MGYYTTYTLKWKVQPNRPGEKNCAHRKPAGALFCPQCGIKVGEKGVNDIVGDYLGRNQESFGVTVTGEAHDPLKWYEHEDDLKAMSKEIKDVLFTLSGEGEESGDIWDKYFLNGKMQVCKAEVVKPSFDQTKLK